MLGQHDEYYEFMHTQATMTLIVLTDMHMFEHVLTVTSIVTGQSVSIKDVSSCK